MRKLVRALLGLAVAAGLLWLVFRGTDPRALGRALADVDPLWLLVAQVLLWGSVWARVQRWSYAVRAVQPASFRHLFSATQIGLLVNFTVPARLGEVARATVLSRLAGVPLSRSFALVALDRVNDVVGLLPVLAVAALAVAADAEVLLPPGAFGNSEPLRVSAALVRPAAVLLAVVTLGTALALALLYLRREPIVRLAEAWAGRFGAVGQRAVGVLEGFAEGLHVFRSRADLLRSVGWSLATWAVDVLAVAAVLAACGVAFPWTAPFVVLGLVAAALLVPLTPAVVGQFHLPVVAGLLLAAPGVDPARAKAVAIVDHVSTLFPIAVLGVYSLLRERMGLLDVVRRSEAAEAANPPGERGGGSVRDMLEPR